MNSDVSGGPLPRGTKQAFQLALIVLGFVTLVAWCASVGRPEVIWALRIGTPIVIVGVAAWFIAVSRRPDKTTDFLQQIAPRYWEREGMCFAPLVETRDGACWLSVYFQNRYANHASTRVEVRPPMRSFSWRRHPLCTVEAAIECPGGAFGVWRIPFAVPAKYQGKKLKFEVAAHTKYPNRRGELLRHHSGKPVGPIGGTPQWQAVIVALLGSPLLAALYSSRITRIPLSLPRNVADAAPNNIPPQAEVLWVPNTGGFPVLPVRQAA